MVQAFCTWIKDVHREKWTVYHETSGWDLLLVQDESGVQVGVEAKLSLNAKVISQALPAVSAFNEPIGPDYRAVLVPKKGCQNHLAPICEHIGLTIISIVGYETHYGEKRWNCDPFRLPDEASEYGKAWHPWLPAQRCSLPDYIPDVVGGHAAPIMLTPWKVKAIKLLILLDRFGAVTRADMRALKISPTRWTDRYYGFLTPGKGGYVRCDRTPDLRKQHPTNFAEIERDMAKWLGDVRPGEGDFDALLI